MPSLARHVDSETVKKYLVTDNAQFIVLRALQSLDGRPLSIEGIMLAYDSFEDCKESQKNKNTRKSEYRRAIHEQRGTNLPSLTDRGFVRQVGYCYSHIGSYNITEEGQKALVVTEIHRQIDDMRDRIFLDDKFIQTMLDMTRNVKYVPTEILETGIRGIDSFAQLYRSFPLQLGAQKSKTA